MPNTHFSREKLRSKREKEQFDVKRERKAETERGILKIETAKSFGCECSRCSAKSGVASIYKKRSPLVSSARS